VLSLTLSLSLTLTFRLCLCLSLSLSLSVFFLLYRHYPLTLFFPPMAFFRVRQHTREIFLLPNLLSIRTGSWVTISVRVRVGVRVRVRVRGGG
jgi:hypothetical protein